MERRGFQLRRGLPRWVKPSARTATARLRSRLRCRGRVPVRLLSVIIPAHNEEHYLDKTLAALERQNYRCFETIVVANGCSDGTVQVARGRCDRLIVLSQKSLGVARNLGARLARGELLVFLDADTTLEPLSLRTIAQRFSKNDAVGTLRGRPNANRAGYRLLYWFKNSLHRWRLHSGSSGVIVCRRDWFLRSGGFDEGLEIRENSDLIRRLRRFGRYRFVGEVSATTSMRRYERVGLRPVLWLWVRLWLRSLFADLHRRRYDVVR